MNPRAPCFKVAAYEPIRNAHASTNALRLRQIAGGPIAPMRTPRGSWWSALTKLRIFP